jgi:hypothetical protein
VSPGKIAVVTNIKRFPSNNNGNFGGAGFVSRGILG